MPPGARFGDTIELHARRHVPARGFWVPVSALTEGERGLWSVLTVRAGDDDELRAAREAVEVLHVEGARAFVRGTLSAGHRIVAGGRNRIVAGQRVALSASPAAAQ